MTDIMHRGPKRIMVRQLSLRSGLGPPGAVDGLSPALVHGAARIALEAVQDQFRLRIARNANDEMNVIRHDSDG